MYAVVLPVLGGGNDVVAFLHPLLVGNHVLATGILEALMRANIDLKTAILFFGPVQFEPWFAKPSSRGTLRSFARYGQ